MQDKESDGSTKILAEVVARAIDEVETYDPMEWAQAVLTAIKEAGYAVVLASLLDESLCGKLSRLDGEA